MIPAADITGLVLAGGRATRMGGVDKGLQRYGDATLVARALSRLGPQVGGLAISANRHLDDYATLGVPVWVDDTPGFAGPLAGMLAGLARCATPYLVVVPCDAPLFPLDLVARLMAPFASAVADSAADAGLDVAVAATSSDDGTRIEATFCLLRRTLADRLRDDLAGGERQASRWLTAQRHVVVCFDDVRAFTNVNTREALARAQPS